MSPKELTAFRIDPEVMEALRLLKDRDGVPLSVQVDRALRAWLKAKSVEPAGRRKAARPKALAKLRKGLM